MVFVIQDEDLETYNSLNNYCDMADDLTEKVSTNKELSIKQKQDILYPIIDEIKDHANKMIEDYITYLKDKQNMEKLLKVKEDINIVLDRIDYFKNKIYEVYELNSKKNE